MDFTPTPSNWDPTVDIEVSPMWPFCGNNLNIWKCPSDHSVVNVSGSIKPRVRTMVMNLYLGGFGGTSGNVLPPAYKVYFKYGDLAVPGASKIFVFTDEREDAINWGNFYTDMTGYSPPTPAAYRFADIPAAYHGNAGGFSFGDGHSEIHKWVDGRTYPPIQPGKLIFDGSTPITSSRNKDIGWLQDHATRLK